MRRILIGVLLIVVVAAVVALFIYRPTGDRVTTRPSGTALRPDFRTIELALWPGAAPSVLIDVPVNTKATSSEGPDFVVHYFSRNADARMILYFGHAPSLLSPERAVKEPRSIGGRKVIWNAWTEVEDARTKYFRELVSLELVAPCPVKTQEARPLGLPPLPPQAPPPPPLPSSFLECLTTHVLIEGIDLGEVGALFRSAETLRIKK